MLGTTMLVILGHTKCGAVAAAAGPQEGLDGHLPSLMHAIRPALRGCGGDMRAMVEANVRAQVEKLQASLELGVASFAAGAFILLWNGDFLLDLCLSLKTAHFSHPPAQRRRNVRT